MKAISAGGRFARGMLAGMVLVGGVGVIETTHTLIAVGDLLPGGPKKAMFVVAALGPVMGCAAALGVVMGVALTAIHGIARVIAGKAREPRSVIRAEGILVGASCLGAVVLLYPTFAPQVRRLMNAAIMLSRPALPFLEDVFIETEPKAWIVAAVGVVPAVALGWIWQRTAKRDIAAAEGSVGSHVGTIVRGVAAMGAIAAGLVIHKKTATAYVNQYHDLHIIGLLAVGICLVAAVFLLPPRARAGIEAPFRKPWVVLMVVVAIAGWLVGVHAVLERSHGVEAIVMWRTDAARKAVRFVRSFCDRDGDELAGAFGGDDQDDRDRDKGAWWWPRRAETRAAPASRATAFSRGTPLDHVALISIDALRTDVTGFLGATTSATPGLDRLAAKAVRFRRAYAPGSLTHTTFPAMLRGRHNIGGGRSTTFPEALGARGIFTAAILCGFFREPGGFTMSDISIPHDAVTPSVTTTALVDQVLARPQPRSVFWAHYIDPHAPYVDRSPDGRGGNDYARYLSEIGAADAAVTTLVESLLKTWGPKGAVMIFADHGEEFGEHGSSFHGITVYEDLIHVPLLILAPGLAPRDVDTPTSLIHVAATILDLMHVPAPPTFHGRSLVRLAETGTDADFDATIVSVNNDDMMAYIEPTGRWKLVFEKRLQFVELYDLAEDPRERRNLADERREVLLQVKEKFTRWASEMSPAR